MLSSLQRDGEIGGVCERRLMPDMSSSIFQQDGAPAHTAKITQNWLKTNVPNFWTKDIWPPNSPDLSPMVNHERHHQFFRKSNKFTNARKSTNFRMARSFT